MTTPKLPCTFDTVQNPMTDSEHTIRHSQNLVLRLPTSEKLWTSQAIWTRSEILDQTQANNSCSHIVFVALPICCTADLLHCRHRAKHMPVS